MTKFKRGTRGMNRNAVSCGFFIALTTLSGCYEEYGGAKQAPESSLSRPRVELGGISIELLPNVTPATEEVLDHFQEAHRCELPDVYRQFLMKSNGGIPTQDCIEFVEAGRTTFTDILCFHAIGDQSSHNSVDWHLELFEGRIPKDTLPIARDSWGNLWLLVTRGKASGKIYFRIMARMTHLMRQT